MRLHNAVSHLLAALILAAAWLAMHEGLDLADTDAVARLVKDADLVLQLDPEHQDVTIDGHDVTRAIREPEVSAAVSAVATNLAVRADLVARQKKIIAEARERKTNARELTHFNQLRSRGIAKTSMRLDHVPGPLEPLLWIPDAVAGAVTAARSGQPQYFDDLAGLIELVYCGES